jgi:hypothetical protein
VFVLVRLLVAVIAVRLRGHADAIFPACAAQCVPAELHASFLRRADALFELGDALLCAQAPLASLPQLSLEPVHQRGWGSVYAALARGRIDAERLGDLLLSSLPAAGPLVFAVDVTTWPSRPAHRVTSSSTTDTSSRIGGGARRGRPIRRR